MRSPGVVFLGTGVTLRDVGVGVMLRGVGVREGTLEQETAGEWILGEASVPTGEKPLAKGLGVAAGLEPLELVATGEMDLVLEASKRC